MADTHGLTDQLADISEPALELGFALPWPAWVALALLCIAIAYFAWRQYQRWRFLAAKRQAITMLAGIADNASQINQLLKRVLQHYQQAHPALSLPLAQWQHWLERTGQAPLPELSNLLYSATPDHTHCQQFYRFAKKWLDNYNGAAPEPDIHGGEHA